MAPGGADSIRKSAAVASRRISAWPRAGAEVSAMTLRLLAAYASHSIDRGSPSDAGRPGRGATRRLGRDHVGAEVTQDAAGQQAAFVGQVEHPVPIEEAHARVPRLSAGPVAGLGGHQVLGYRGHARPSAIDLSSG